MGPQAMSCSTGRLFAAACTTLLRAHHALVVRVLIDKDAGEARLTRGTAVVVVRLVDLVFPRVAGVLDRFRGHGLVPGHRELRARAGRRRPAHRWREDPAAVLVVMPGRTPGALLVARERGRSVHLDGGHRRPARPARGLDGWAVAALADAGRASQHGSARADAVPDAGDAGCGGAGIGGHSGMTMPPTEGIDHLGDDRLVEVLVRPRQGDPDLLRRIRDVLDREDGLLGIAHATPAMLREAGLPPAVAQRLAAACELGRRVAVAKRRARPSCRSPEEAVTLMAPEIAARPNEELWVLPLDPRLGLISQARMISRGSPSGTEADPAVIMRTVLSAGASSFILVHQHPSGDPSPSADDRAITTRIAGAGRLLGVPLRDHIVIGDGGRFISLRRENPDLFR